MKFLAVIPARGGSKGIPRKNLVEICGKPLISYTIEAAVNACNIDRVIVSTEDEEINNVSNSYGVEVIKRPIELATDKSTTLSVLQHVKKILHKEGYIPDAIITLQPTSPLRTSRHIDEAINIFSKDKNADCLVSCIQVPHIYHPLSVMKKNPDGYLESYLGEKEITRRQDKPQVFARNGAAIYITKISRIEEYVFGGKLLPYFMDEQSSIDVDTQLDLTKVKQIIEKNEAYL